MISALGTVSAPVTFTIGSIAGRSEQARFDTGRRTCKCYRSLRISPRRAFADPAGSPSPFAFQVQRRFGKLARVTSPRSASESKSPSIESAAPSCLRAGRSSATTSPRSVTSMVSPLRTSRRYSDNLDFSCLTPTDFIVLTVATVVTRSIELRFDLRDVEG